MSHRACASTPLHLLRHCCTQHAKSLGSSSALSLTWNQHAALGAAVKSPALLHWYSSECRDSHRSHKNAHIHTQQRLERCQPALAPPHQGGRRQRCQPDPCLQTRASSSPAAHTCCAAAAAVLTGGKRAWWRGRPPCRPQTPAWQRCRTRSGQHCRQPRGSTAKAAVRCGKLRAQASAAWLPISAPT